MAIRQAAPLCPAVLNPLGAWPAQLLHRILVCIIMGMDVHKGINDTHALLSWLNLGQCAATKFRRV